jgi:hypothetical protein
MVKATRRRLSLSADGDKTSLQNVFQPTDDMGRGVLPEFLIPVLMINCQMFTSL